MIATLDITPEALAALPPEDLAYLDWQLRWTQTARPNQLPPEGDWDECGYMAGRGFGKTRVGAEWLGRATYEDDDGYDAYVICPTLSDVKFTAFEGESGLLSIVPPELILEYNKSDLFIRMKNRVGKSVMLRGFSSEKPERLRGPQGCRAWCFIAGTMVATPEGERPIEALRPGDLVITRRGPRPVLANSRRRAVVGEVTFAHGRNLIGTADHPVYLASGWTRLDRLRAGDKACAVNASSGVASAGTATAAATTSAPTSRSGRSARFGCTLRSGRRRTAHRLRATTSTTATTTAATMRSVTSSACLTAITSGTTGLAAIPYPNATGPLSPTSLWNVPTAARPCAASGSPQQSPAAAANSAGRIASVRRRRSNAPVAAQRSAPGPATTAVSVVSTWRRAGRQSVYCLKVAGEPEYFANGVLVHNCDELAAWQNDKDTWSNMQFGLRLGRHPQVLWTTTPKPRPLVRDLTKPQPGRVIVRGATYDNRSNLPRAFFKQLEQYEGTVLGRQELHGELIDPEESGIIRRSWFRLWPSSKPLPPLSWVLMSLDTAYTEATIDKKTGDADFTACTVWGSFVHGKESHVILLDCWQEQLGLPDLIKRVRKELNVAYGDEQDAAVLKPLYGAPKPATSGRKVDLVVIEDKGSGISLRQSLEREGIMAHAYNPGRADKLARLHMVSTIFARRRVWLPESATRSGSPRTWIEPLLEQLCAFSGPGTTEHDDFVDSTTQAMRVMMDKGLVTIVRPPAGEPPAMDRRRIGERPLINPYAS